MKKRSKFHTPYTKHFRCKSIHWSPSFRSFPHSPDPAGNRGTVRIRPKHLLAATLTLSYSNKEWVVHNTTWGYPNRLLDRFAGPAQWYGMKISSSLFFPSPPIMGCNKCAKIVVEGATQKAFLWQLPCYVVLLFHRTSYNTILLFCVLFAGKTRIPFFLLLGGFQTTKPALPGSTVSITHSGPNDKKTVRNSYHCTI